jgi:anti-anti-sigma factor
MRKILVIDDEKSTLSMFRLFLSAYGYTVLTAENGKEGLLLFEQEKPSIVLTDIKMPGMDGIEVLRRIKELEESTEVIMITGHGDMDLAVEALDLEAADFVNKPINKQALDSALKRAEHRLELSGEEDEGKVSLRRENDVALLDIKGSVTSSSAPSITEAYEKASADGATKILVHFDENCSVNGAGISTLMELLSESQKRSQLVAMTGLSENFKKVFELVGITRLAKIYATPEDALNSFL